MDGMKVALIAALAVVAIGGVSILSYVSMSNTEIRLRNQVEAKQDVLKSHHDKMWKTLSQQAEVSDEYKDAFAEIYPKLISGRYGADEAAKMFNVKVVQEDNPEFDNSLYAELSRTIESERTSFHRAQSSLIDVQREHKNHVTTFPGSILGVSPVEIQLVTSTNTDKAFETGNDDNTNLFGGK